MKHYDNGNPYLLVIDNLERNLEWAAKILLGQAILFIRVFPVNDAHDLAIFDRPVTVQELEVFGKHAYSVIVMASVNGEWPDDEAIHAGDATWLGDIVNGQVACGSLLALLCPNLA